MAQEVDIDLALNVMNELRRRSQGQQGISANDLADAILKERISNPKKTYITLMRTRVYAIVKGYFPYAKPETPVKLGDGNTKGADSTTGLKVGYVDRDALIIKLLSFIADAGASELMPDELTHEIKKYVIQQKLEKTS